VAALTLRFPTQVLPSSQEPSKPRLSQPEMTEKNINGKIVVLLQS
jgi:hypothetical protein